MRRTGNATMNHVARNIHRHETSSFSMCTTSRGGGRTSPSLSLSLSPPSLLSSLPFSSSLSVRTTHVQAIRYDWSNPRFRTNHFIKAVLNKPAFDYIPHHLRRYRFLYLPPLVLRTLLYRMVSLKRKRVFLVVYLFHWFSTNFAVHFQR